MRHPSEIDDLHLEHSNPDHSWAQGELELSDERPATALSSDPGHRKWMLIGVGGCGVVTAIAVLLLTRDPGQPQAAQQPPEVEQAVSELAVEPAPSEPASDPAVGPATEVAGPINAADKPTTLAATTTRSSPAPKKAPPIPAATPSKPAATPSKPAATPSKPASSKPALTPSAPAPAQPKIPSLPSADQSSSEPESDLPDVEGWDEADAAVERDEPAADPAPSEPPPVTPDVVDDANSAI